MFRLFEKAPKPRSKEGIDKCIGELVQGAGKRTEMDCFFADQDKDVARAADGGGSSSFGSDYVTGNAVSSTGVHF